MSAISGTIAGVMAAKSQRDANNVNRENVRDTNDQNYRMYLLSRGYSDVAGTNGFSQLPFYSRINYYGKDMPVEFALNRDTTKAYTAARDAAPSYADYVDAYNQTQPGVAGSNQAVNNLFNGTTEQNQLAWQQPVSAARVSAAKTTGNSALDALYETLNQIKAINAQKGYSSDSMGSRMLDFSARRQAYQQQAGAMSNANLENAMDTRTIHNNAVVSQLQNASMPFTMAQNNANILGAPQQAFVNDAQRRQSLFNWFKIGTDKYQYQNLPIVQPVPSNLGIAAQASGNMTKQFGQAYLAGGGGGGGMA